MKKLFTLALALSVAFVGFAQVQKASIKDLKPVAAQEQTVTGEEVFEYVGNEVNMMRYQNEELDYSMYDWQTNTAAKNWTMHFPDGCLGFSYTVALETDLSDRGTEVVIYNPNTDTWTTSNGLVEDHKTGFGCAARYGENGVVVVSRNPATYTCEVYIIEDKDNLPSGTLSPIYVMPGSQNENNPHFPTVMCTGPNHDHIHILVTALNMTVNDQDNPFYYFRSMDGGTSWEEYMTIDFLGRDYCPKYGSGQDAYFMENTGGNELNIVLNTRRGDGVVLTSEDEGDTWTRTEFYHHPGPDTDFGEARFFYPRWTSALWDNNGVLHVAYEYNAGTGDATSTSYYPGMGGVAYWNSEMPYRGESVAYGFDPNNPMPPVNGQPFIIDSAYLAQDIYASWWLWSDATHEMWPEYIGYVTPLDENEQPLEDPYEATEFSLYDNGLTNHGHYNCGISAMPVLMQAPAGDMLVAVWMSLDDHNITGGSTGDMAFFKLFARASFDNGITWTPMVHLTSDFMLSITEHNYPQAAIDNHNQLVVAVQTDGEPDSYTIGTGGDTDQTDNCYTGYVFDLNELFGYDGIEEGPIAHNTFLSVYPNPASENLVVTLNQEETMVICNMMGQTVSTVKGYAGANTIDISSLSSGVYFISAGSATQKFVVK